jgi:hypothetical protein
MNLQDFYPFDNIPLCENRPIDDGPALRVERRSDRPRQIVDTLDRPIVDVLVAVASVPTISLIAFPVIELTTVAMVRFSTD